MSVEEKRYIRKRIWKAKLQSIPFYLCRILPIRKRKIVFCCIEGTTGYSCNPKYIAEEFIRQNETTIENERFELVWLVNDVTKQFPSEIKVVKNTLWNRAYELSTAHFWIDNSRKQLEVRKRKGQIYIQTWHAKLGFKPTCLDRGASFSKIAYLVSKHDSDMVDYWLSNSDWYDQTLPTGSLYNGKILRTGSPRCDILVQAARDEQLRRKIKEDICKKFDITMMASESQKCDINEIHFMMYAPTFRGGNQGTNRTVEIGDHFPDYTILIDALEKRFGGKWIILLRLHPQLVARHLDGGIDSEYIVDASRVDDMYEILAGCDAFLTDYSSAAFDAAVMEIPVFLYADDYGEYERERWKLLWDLRDEQFPFLLSTNNETLKKCISEYNGRDFQFKLMQMFKETGMTEHGKAVKSVVEKLLNLC